MAGDGSIMTFLAFPREVRDLIYTYLATKDETYFIATPNITTTGDPLPNLGIINSCKTIQYEMLETLCPHNTFGFSFPCLDADTKSLFQAFAPRLTRVEFYINFSTVPWQRFRLGGNLDPVINWIDDQVCKAICTWNAPPIERESCRIIIRDNAPFISPLLEMRVFEVMKTLSRVETVLINMHKFSWHLKELGTFLGPSLGPNTVHYERIPPDLGRKYGCIKFHPRKFLAEMKDHVDGEICSNQE